MTERNKEQLYDIVAGLIDLEMKREINQCDAMKEPIPKELDEKQRALIRELEAERKAEKRVYRRKRGIQTVAAILLCTTLTVGTSMGVSEGFRKKVFQIFNYEQDGAIALRAEEEALIGSWSGYWYPTYLPEGFKLMEADEMDHFLLFRNDQDEEIRLYENDSQNTFSLDTDTLEKRQIKIGVHDGSLFIGDDIGCSIAVWMTDTKTMCLYVIGLNESSEIENILDGLEYVK